MTSERTALIGTLLPRDSDDLSAVLDALTPGRDGDLVELRLDALVDAESRVEELIERSPLPVVATCRRARDGGRVARSEPARLDLLARAAAAGARWIDVEHDVPCARVPGGARVLRSAHLEAPPESLRAFVATLLAAPADAAKLVVAAAPPAGVLALLEQVRAHAGRLAAHVLSVPSSRALSATLGAPFTYGLLRPRDGFRFPFPSVRELREQGRVGCTGPGTRAFLLIGGAVDRSVSPFMLRRAFVAAGADRVALPWSCPDPLPALDAIERFGWAGAAVTLPHKQTVLAELRRRGATVHASAEEVGATNTVLFDAGRWHAHNTDRGGLLDALREPPGVDVGGAVALILGAGGAARAAVRAAQDLGARPTVWARDPHAAHRLARDFGGTDVAATIDDALVRAPRLVIDATPAGEPGGTPLLDPSRLPPGAVVLDMLVGAHPTALTAAARAAGLDAREGISMLAFQAARQVGLLGDPLPEGAVLRRAGVAELARRDRSIVLVGLRATGKSTLGKELARRLDLPFVDTDDEVERETGRSPDDWIASGQEARFRRAERDVLARLAAGARAVIATGGGAVLHRDELARLAARALVVHLDADDSVLLARLAAAPRAPLGDGAAAEQLAAQRAARDAALRAVAHLHIDTGAIPEGRAADIVADHLFESSAPA